MLTQNGSFQLDSDSQKMMSSYSPEIRELTDIWLSKNRPFDGQVGVPILQTAVSWARSVILSDEVMAKDRPASSTGTYRSLRKYRDELASRISR